MMNKEQLIKALVEEFGMEEEELKGLKNKELKEILDSKRKEKAQGEEDTEEVKEGEKEESKESEEEGSKGKESDGDEPIYEFDLKLRIYESRVIDLVHGAGRTVVENLGGGDVFVDTVSVKYDGKSRIKPGEKKEFKGVKRIFVGSASRPTIRVKSYLK